MQILRDLHLPG